MRVLRTWTACGLAGFLGMLVASVSQAASVTVFTDTSWRAIGPAGNNEGCPLCVPATTVPIASVGGAFEAANPGWNTDLSFDDTAAGWGNAISFSVQPGFLAHRIWVDGNHQNGSTPAYFRKTFSLPGAATAATLIMRVDDDAQVYLNGTLVVDDQNATTTTTSRSVAGNLHGGLNLIAVKAHDSFGLTEDLAIQINITAVPEPHEYAMMLMGLALVAWRLRQRVRI